MEPFRVALCQVRAFDLEDAEANLANILRALDEAGAAGARLVALPECAYPAYYVRDVHPYARPGVRPYVEIVGLLAAKAARYGYWLAAGLAVPHEDGTLTNSGVVFGPEGAVRGRYDKSFLWHFDTTWFTAGQAYPTWDAGFARFGVLICADGRIPEIARCLAVNGAEIILDLTAWVSSGRTMAELSTSQCEYLMPVRARENGVWVAAADKWGVEDGHTVYAGRSSVFDPAGATRFCAPTDEELVAVFDIAPMPAPGLPERRPTLYGLLAEPLEALPVAGVEREPLAPADAIRRAAVVPGSGRAAFDPAGMAARFATLRAQDAGLVVFAGARASGDWRRGAAPLEAVVRDHGGAIAFAVESDDGERRRSAFLVTPEGTVAHQASHGCGLALGGANAPVVETACGRVALLCGEEALVPEVARDLALRGTDVVAWCGFETLPLAEQFQRARSDENRVYVAAARHGGGMITSPDGVPLQVSPEGSGIAMAANVNLALSRSKERAPHTNVMAGRFPASYAALVR